MTYVREQTSEELAAHMRSLQRMEGWFEPLADRLWQEVEALQATIAQQAQMIEHLRGIQPDFPPWPPEGEGLPRYGLRWNGPQQPLAVLMTDGYWTPWHLADQLKAENEELRANASLLALLPELDEALEDLEIQGQHSDQGYRKLKDWYRKIDLACKAIDAATSKEG